MASIGLFERIASTDNLRSAWVKAKQYARTEEVYFDAYAYEGFEEHLEANLAALRHELLGGTYQPVQLRYVAIPKENNVRKLYFIEPRDSVVIQAVINVIGPLFEADFSAFSFGNRLNTGERESHDVYRRWQDQYNSYSAIVRSFLNEGPDAWYMITDIQNFYPSIRLERLRGLIAAKVTDERTLTIIESFLNLQAITLDGQAETITGLPAGPSYAHFFANIYLTGFDNLAVQSARRYARYVDDICLACQDQKELTEVEKLLSAHLEQWNQFFKPGKTIRRPVKDPLPLIEHTYKMKYVGRLDFVEALELGPQQIEAARDAERLLSDLYLVVEKEGDIDRLVEDAGIVLSQLSRLSAPNLGDTIYSLLETHPLKPSTLRVALSCLLKIELPNPSQRFLQYLCNRSDDWGYIRIILLQILPCFAQDASGLKKTLIEEFARDPNYLVRANTYVALKNLARNTAISLSTEELRGLREAETSSYALQRLIDCYGVVSGEAVWLPVVSLVAADNLSQTASIARAFCQLLESRHIEPAMLDSILPSFERIEVLSVEIYTHLFYLTSRFGAPWMVSQVLNKARAQIGEQISNKLFSIVAFEVIEEFAQQTQLERLYQFAELASQVGLRTEAELGFGEVASRAEGSELKQLAQSRRDALRRASISAGLPKWYANDPTCNRGLYREQRGDSEYLCFEFTSEPTQRTGTLELISLRRIQGSGFSDIDEWVTYLRHLSKEGLVSLIEAGHYEEDGLERAFCLYERPPGFRTLKEWLQHPNVEGLLPASVTLEVGLSLVQAISESQCNDFHLCSIDPLNVLWNPTGEIKLLNLGASLGIASYQCGIPGCTVSFNRDEIGPSSSTYHLGLLLLQLLRKDCPLQAINSTCSRYGDRSELSDLVDKPGISPHFRLILTRMLNKVLDYRYSSLSCLEGDLRAAIEFARSGPATDWHTLQDFVTFRLRIISRNPEIKSHPPMIQARDTLKGLSDSLKILPQSMLSNWQVRIEMSPRFSVFPSGRQARKLSPEGRRLLGISEGWERSAASSQLRHHTPTPLTKLCLYQILAIEASACVAACIAATQSISPDTALRMKNLALNLMGELKNTSSIELIIRPSHQTSFGISTKFRSEDVQQLQQFVLWMNGDGDSVYTRQVNSLNATGLFLVLFGFDCELFRGDQLIARSEPVSHLEHVKLRGRNLWQLLKDLAVLDEEISHFEGTCFGNGNGTYAEQAAEAWTRIPEIISFIQHINPSKRYPAELYSYSYWERQGILRLVFPHFGERSFSRSKHFLSGNLVKEYDAKRPLRVDILRSLPGRPGEISSVLAPLGYFKELPLSGGRVSPAQIAGWMRRHPHQRRLALTALGLGAPSVFVWFLKAALSGGISAPALGEAISGLLGSISLNLFATTLESFLATRHPEDAQLVE